MTFSSNSREVSHIMRHNKPASDSDSPHQCSPLWRGRALGIVVEPMSLSK
jgi:hypothetical protein